MNGLEGEPLKVALLHHCYGTSATGTAALVETVARALRDAGQRPCVLTSHLRATCTAIEDGIAVVRARRLPEAPLRYRGFTGPLTQLPASVRILLTGDYDVAHAFSPSDALAALCWRACVGRPVIFTPAEPIERRGLADRRLRMWLIERSIEDSDAVVAPSEHMHSALWRWLAVEAEVIDPSDAAAHVRVYRDAIVRRGCSPVSQRQWIRRRAR